MIRAASEKMVRQFLRRDEDKPAGERSALMYIAMQRSFEKGSYYFPTEVLFILFVWQIVARSLCTALLKVIPMLLFLPSFRCTLRCARRMAFRLYQSVMPFGL